MKYKLMKNLHFMSVKDLRTCNTWCKFIKNWEDFLFTPFRCFDYNFFFIFQERKVIVWVLECVLVMSWKWLLLCCKVWVGIGYAIHLFSFKLHIILMQCLLVKQNSILLTFINDNRNPFQATDFLELFADKYEVNSFLGQCKTEFIEILYDASDMVC